MIITQRNLFPNQLSNIIWYDKFMTRITDYRIYLLGFSQNDKYKLILKTAKSVRLIRIIWAKAT